MTVQQDKLIKNVKDLLIKLSDCFSDDSDVCLKNHTHLNTSIFSSSFEYVFSLHFFIFFTLLTVQQDKFIKYVKDFLKLSDCFSGDSNVCLKNHTHLNTSTLTSSFSYVF